MQAKRMTGHPVLTCGQCVVCRYAIASYLLQSKDRHNGNILIDTQGRLVHIDFGFILEISPGANMRFESAAFKLSHEMTQLLDPSGQRDSSQFHMFEELCIRGFLAVFNIAPFILTCCYHALPVVIAGAYGTCNFAF